MMADGFVLLKGILEDADGRLYFRPHLDVDVSHVFMSHLIDINHCVEQLLHSFACGCGGWDDGNSEHFSESGIIQIVA